MEHLLHELGKFCPNIDNGLENNDIYEMGRVYEKIKGKEIRKASGQYFTPKFLIDYILKRTVYEVDILENPFVKILDPACGSGFFLCEVYDILQAEFEKNIDSLRIQYSKRKFRIGSKVVHGEEYWKKENIPYHILKNCIYGCDVDPYSVRLTEISLYIKSKQVQDFSLNIKVCDSLIEEIPFDCRFDFIIGNPPYIGHKDLVKGYKIQLKEKYNHIFKDKSDISFCFIFKFSQENILKGKLCFVTSRYFLESINAIGLRKYLQTLKINFIVDFFGTRPIKALGIDPAVICLEKGSNEVNNDIHIIKIIEKDFGRENDIIGKHVSFTLNQRNLHESGWILVPDDVRDIIERIERKCEYSLLDICDSHQGIITGCDSAFIVDTKIVEAFKLEKSYLRRWIKSSNINKYYTSGSTSSYCIYTKQISEKEFINSRCYTYLNKFKEYLVARKGLECNSKWYLLHRARKEDTFIREKIIFPFKSSTNNFSINKDGAYFSADIYALTIKQEFCEILDYYFLAGLLNSKIYELYFKTFGKKLGKKLYDYYPNKIMKIKIPINSELSCIGSLTKEIINGNLHAEKKIEEILEKYFDLNKEEISMLEEFLGL